jgi:hypothetical protein
MTAEEMEKRLQAVEGALKELEKGSGLLRTFKRFMDCKGAT